jgi:hypothetical protein
MNICLKTALIVLIMIPVTISADWLSHDNGAYYGQAIATGQDDGYGVKFEPGETGLITKVKAYIGRHTPPVWNGFNVWLYGWNDPQQQPSDDPVQTDPENPLGVLIGSGDNNGWFELDFPDQDWPTADPFVIALTNKFGSPDVDTIYYDSGGPGGMGLYWYLLNGSWQQHNPAGDLMVRVWFSGSPVESTSLGSIKAVYK